MRPFLALLLALVPLAALADAHWTAGHEELGWDEMTRWTCRTHGGFDPDIRHRTNDAIVTLGLVARGLTVALLPGLPLLDPPRGIAVRAVEGADVWRAVFAATPLAAGLASFMDECGLPPLLVGLNDSSLGGKKAFLDAFRRGGGGLRAELRDAGQEGLRHPGRPLRRHAAVPDPEKFRRAPPQPGQRARHPQ